MDIRHPLYQALLRADEAFDLALRRQFPGLRYMNEVRYQNDRHNAETAKARDAYHAASEAIRNAG